MEEKEILRKPNAWPQTNVLTRTEREILYWWARWWGKTDAWINRLSRWVDNPWFRALVLRETYSDLVDWIDRSMDIYSELWWIKTWNPSVIRFPSGAEIRTGYLKWQSYEKYKGHEYQKMLIEEVTLIAAEEKYEKLLWSLRSTVDWLKPQIFLTTNPDGVWRLWVKRRFVDKAPPWEVYTDEQGNTRIFIPAKVTDNPVLIEKDPSYVNYLNGIQDEQLRKAWLEWDWDAYDVKWSIYGDQIKQARSEWRFCRVPRDPDLDVYTVWDIGIWDAMALLFYQVYWREVRLIDSYTNEWYWVKHYARVMKDKPYKYKYTFFPHDANKRSPWSGKTFTDHAREYDVPGMIKVLKRTSDKWADINKARALFAYCYVDNEKCKTFLEHIEIYRKEYDEKRAIFKNEPHHGAESHYADSYRYLSDSCWQYLFKDRKTWSLQAKR